MPMLGKVSAISGGTPYFSLPNNNIVSCSGEKSKSKKLIEPKDQIHRITIRKYDRLIEFQTNLVFRISKTQFVEEKTTMHFQRTESSLTK